MADTELNIVIQARDLLSKELERVNRLLRTLGTTASGEFEKSEASAREAAAAVDKFGQEGREAGADVSSGARRATTELGLIRQTALLASRGVAGIGVAARALIAPLAGIARAARAAIAPLLPFLTVAGAGLAFQRAASGATEFSRAMTEVSTIVDTTAVNVDRLSENVLDLARAQGLNESLVAKGLYQVISSGVSDAAKAFDVLAVSSRLGIAGLATTEQAVDLITSATNAYARQNLGAARAADVLFKTVELGKTTIEELAGSFGRVLPLGASLGVTIEELSAFLASLTLSGLSTEEAATSLRGVLNAMLNVTDEGAAILERFGLSFDPAIVRAKGLAATLIEVNDAVGGDTAALRELFPETRALIGALSVLNDGGVRLSSTLDQVRNSAGAAGVAFDKQMADPARQLTVLVNSLRQGFSQAFGRAFLSSVSRAGDELGGMESAVERINEVAQVLGGTFGGLFSPFIDGAVAAVRQFSDFVEQIGGAEALLGRLGGVFRAFSDLAVSSIRLIGAEVRLFGALIAQIPGQIEQVRAEVTNLTSVRVPLVDPSAEEELLLLREAQKELEAIVDLKRQVESVGGSINVDEIESDLREALDFGFIKFNVQLDREDVDSSLRELESIVERRKLAVELEIKGEQGSLLGGIDADAKAALDKLALEVTNASDQQSEAGKALGKALGDGFSLGLEEAALSVDIDVVREKIAALRDEAERRVRLGLDTDDISRQIDSLNVALTALGRRAEQPLQIDADDAPLRAALSQANRDLEGVEDQLETLRSLASLPVELRGLPAVERAIRQIVADRPDLNIDVELLLDEARLETLRRTLVGRVAQIREEISRLSLNALIPDPVEVPIEFSVAGLDQQVQEALAAAQNEATRAGAIVRLGELFELGEPDTEQLRAFIGAINLELRDGVTPLEADQLITARTIAEAQVQARELVQSVLGEFDGFEEAAGILDQFVQQTGDLEGARELADALLDELEARQRIAAVTDEQRAALENLISARGDELEAIRRANEARQAAEEFARENPVQAQILVDGVRGLSGAIGSVAGGFQTAGEAAEQFFRGMLGRIAEAIAQQLILKTLIESLPTDAGNFLGQAFGIETEAVALETAAGAAAAALQTGGTTAGAALEAGAGAAAVTLGTSGATAGVGLETGAGVAGGVLITQAGLAGGALETGGTLAGAAILSQAVLAAEVLAGASLLTGVAKGAVFPAVALQAAQGELLAGHGTPAIRAALGAVAPGSAGEAALVAFQTGGLPAGTTGPTGSVPRGQIVTRPQVEPLALFGEAGPEAIAPLIRDGAGRLSFIGNAPGQADPVPLPVTRGPDGRLGVDLGGDSLAMVLSALKPKQAFQAGGAFGGSVASPASASPQQPGQQSAGGVTVNLTTNFQIQTLEGDRAAAVILRERETISAVVAEQISRSPAFKAAVRGDRV